MFVVIVYDRDSPSMMEGHLTLASFPGSTLYATEKAKGSLGYLGM